MKTEGFLDEFEIKLKKNDSVFYPDDKIEGLIKLKVTQKTLIKSLSLQAYGRAIVKWFENYSNEINDEEVYFDTKENLFDNNVETCLEKGEYTFNFNVQLPDRLPTSLEHKNAKIRYSLIAKIEFSKSSALNKCVLKHFTVVNHVDLNTNEELNEPYSIDIEKSICCGNSIVANLILHKIGYCPGEKLSYNVLIDNRSSRDIKMLQLSLIQQIRVSNSRIPRNHTDIYVKLVKIECERIVKSQTSYDWHETVLKVPSTCSTLNSLSRIIDVNYALMLSFREASIISSTTNLTIPIVIGTIPIRGKIDSATHATIRFEPCGLQNDKQVSPTFTPLYPVCTSTKILNENDEISISTANF